MTQYRSTLLALVLAGATVPGLAQSARANNDAHAGDARAGEAVYNQTCVACHGPDGKGVIPGAPNFTRTDGVLTQSDEVLLKHMLDGFQSRGSQMAMPAKGGNDDLTIRDLRNVLRYLHEKFHYKSYR